VSLGFLIFLCKNNTRKSSELESYESLLATEKLPHTTPVATLDTTRDSGDEVTLLRTTRTNNNSDLAAREEFESALSSYSEYAISQRKLDKAAGGFRSVLGKGAFATVYLGVLKGVKVAIKVDSPALMKQSKKMRRIVEQQYIYEIETLYEYCHPNICALIAHCADGPTRSLVYELCEGGDLLDRIAAEEHREHPPLTWPQRLKIALGIARGVGFLHSVTPHPIVHRDVKVFALMFVDFSLPH
jgi:hypothetical protein